VRSGIVSVANASSVALEVPAARAYGFWALLTYYWALQFALRSGESPERGGALYALSIIPVAAYAVLVFVRLVVSGPLNRHALLVIAYGAIVCTIALSRGDFSTIASVGLYSVAVTVILGRQLPVSVSLLNVLLLSSIVVNALMHAMGRSIYAVIPGFTGGGELPWRVSLFPSVATSAFFSLVVVLANLLRSDGVGRRLCIILGAYFLVLSGIRSALSAAGLAMGYLLLVRVGFLKSGRSRFAYVVVSLVVFVASLFAAQVVLVASEVGGAAIGEYLLRTGDGFSSESDVARAIYRTYIWSEHLRIAGDHPLTGAGTFEFTALSTYDPVFGDSSSGSESFLTGLYARGGQTGVLFVAAYVWLLV
jgi:hypothetical protein